MSSRINGSDDHRPFTTVVNDKHKRRENKAKAEAKLARRNARLEEEQRQVEVLKRQQEAVRQRLKVVQPVDNAAAITSSISSSSSRSSPPAPQPARRLVAQPMVVLDIKAFLINRPSNIPFTQQDVEGASDLFYRANVVAKAIDELHATGILRHDVASNTYSVNPVVLGF